MNDTGPLGIGQPSLALVVFQLFTGYEALHVTGSSPKMGVWMLGMPIPLRHVIVFHTPYPLV